MASSVLGYECIESNEGTCTSVTNCFNRVFSAELLDYVANSA